MGTRFDRILTAGAALVLAVFGLLPIVNWIPHGESAPWFDVVAATFLPGLALALGFGLVLAILTKPLMVRWPARAGAAVARAVGAQPGLVTLGVASAALLLYGLVARGVLAGRPLLIDEIIQVYQARIFSHGRLWLPASPHGEFFSSLHLVDTGGKVYSQFPAGGSALLALGTLTGAEWLVDPVFAALSVGLWGAVLRRMEPRPLVAFGALLLFAFAPFTAFMAGSHMNHVTALTWTLVGVLGLTAAVDPRRERFRDGLLCGLGFGLAATIRPVDALAFAAPAGVWLLWRAVRSRRLAALLGAGLGIGLPMAALLLVNRATTGAPLLFGYTVLWGRAHDLGFHATPWGPGHTPRRGIELLSLYFLRLQTYLFELPVPSLLPATAALALARRMGPLDRYLLVASALLCGFYFAYWHDGFYLGPRFFYPLLPALTLWTARFWPAVRERLGGGLAYRCAIWAGVVAILVGAGSVLPARIRQYRSGMLSPRWDADAAAAQGNIRGAIIFVRESWGAELVARLWALGVSRPEGEAIYRAADPCHLDLALQALERAGLRDAAATAALQPLLADSVHLTMAQDVTGDPTVRLTRGARYPEHCVRRIRENHEGFTLFAPLLLARGGGNLYARDLGARDSLLLRDFPGHPVYLLRPASGAVGAVPVFYPLRRDSLFGAWRGGD